MKVSKAFASLPEFERRLIEEDKAAATVVKYISDVRIFLSWCAENSVGGITMPVLRTYRDFLSRRRKESGCNSVVISLNRFFRMFAASEHLHLRTVRLQRRTSLESVFSREDYKAMLQKAREMGNERAYCIMRTLASSGMRVGELVFVTVEILSSGICFVRNKGRAREVFIPPAVCALLREYCGRNGITSGIVFRSKKNSSRMMDKSAIWRDFNRIREALKMPVNYVHAHNFRHFFAKEYYLNFKNLPELADLLGHTSIETTRIYTRTTMAEKMARVSALNL